MTVTPINYRLEFEPILAGSVFRGTAEILVECDGAATEMTLNAAELDIRSCSVETDSGLLPARTVLRADREEMRVIPPEPVEGRCTLHIGFTGILNDRLLGFYRSKYKDGSKIKYLATTQFEAADARRAFPCWDRPDAKATFEISIVCGAGLTAISNMPEVSFERSGRKVLHRFAKTPKMSTYLVYLGVGDFEHIERKAGGVAIRVVTVRGHRRLGRYALDLAACLLPAYERYFGIKYPLPKLDLIAVPDFAAGAMENWGAITFREVLLLYNPKTSSTRTRRLIAEVISHEIAHQWFGNLVTMKWWNDLWLNESFATFMATKFVDELYPEWDVWGEFIEETMGAAMRLDGLDSTHPIDVRVDSPSQIREIFDAISYNKGSCVLVMLEDYVGRTGFRRGLRRYLSRFKYGNAKGGDLWDSIGVASGLPVSRMMQTWIGRSGFPVLRAGRSGSGLLLEQSRFRYIQDGTEHGEPWQIPVSVAAGGRRAKGLMASASDSLELRGRGFALANPGRKGFYRVSYAGADLKECKGLVARHRISGIDRWAVQNDLFAMCTARKEPASTYLDFSDAYLEEENYAALSDTIRNLFFVYRLVFFERDSFPAVSGRIEAYLRHVFARLGWRPARGEPQTYPLLRALTVRCLGMTGDPAVLAKAGKLFSAAASGDKLPPADIQEAVYSLAAWGGGSDTSRALRRMYRGAGSQEEAQRALRALGMFKDANLLMGNLDFALTGAVRSQDVHMVIVSASSNPFARPILWDWLVRRWSGVVAKVGQGNPLLGRIVSSVVLTVDSSMEGTIRRFFRENPAPGTERALDQALEWVRINDGFLDGIRSDGGA